MGHNDHCYYNDRKITLAVCAGCPQSSGCPFKPEEPEDSVEWFMMENLCDDCALKVDGCVHRYDDEQCMSERHHS